MLLLLIEGNVLILSLVRRVTATKCRSSLFAQILDGPRASLLLLGSSCGTGGLGRLLLLGRVALLRQQLGRNGPVICHGSLLLLLGVVLLFRLGRAGLLLLLFVKGRHRS